MRKLIWTLPLVLVLSACNKPDLPTLLTWAQYGIDADCALGSGALAQNICTFGDDAIVAAKAAAAKDPKNGIAAVKQILVDTEKAKPELAPYLDWLVNEL